MLKLINNKNINGNFFIEDFDEREEKDRVKIYDSDENYLDYLPLEEDDTPIEEQYDGYVEMLESFKTVPDLMDWLVCDCDFIGNESEAIKYILTEIMPDNEFDLLDNEWVNRIGDVYIIIAEY